MVRLPKGTRRDRASARPAGPVGGDERVLEVDIDPTRRTCRERGLEAQALGRRHDEIHVAVVPQPALGVAPRDGPALDEQWVDPEPVAQVEHRGQAPVVQARV